MHRCGNPINVSSILQQQVQEQARKEFEKQLAEKEQFFKMKEDSIALITVQMSKQKKHDRAGRACCERKTKFRKGYF